MASAATPCFDESGLLHELLVALVGFHGDVFVDTGGDT